MQRLKKVWFGGSLALVVGCCALVAATAQADQKALIDRVEQLGGQLTRDPAGEIIGINLENRPATDADLELLSDGTESAKTGTVGVGYYRCGHRSAAAALEADRAAATEHANHRRRVGETHRIEATEEFESAALHGHYR